jgi:hypothetical protein
MTSASAPKHFPNTDWFLRFYAVYVRYYHFFVQVQNVEWQNVEWQNVKWQNVEWQNVEWQNVEWQNVKWQNVKRQSVERQNVDIQIVEKKNWLKLILSGYHLTPAHAGVVKLIRHFQQFFQHFVLRHFRLRPQIVVPLFTRGMNVRRHMFGQAAKNRLKQHKDQLLWTFSCSQCIDMNWLLAFFRISSILWIFFRIHFKVNSRSSRYLHEWCIGSNPFSLVCKSSHKSHCDQIWRNLAIRENISRKSSINFFLGWPLFLKVNTQTMHIKSIIYNSVAMFP